MEQFAIDEAHLRLFTIGSIEIAAEDLSLSRKSSEHQLQSFATRQRRSSVRDPAKQLKHDIKRNHRLLKENLMLKKTLKNLQKEIEKCGFEIREFQSRL